MSLNTLSVFGVASSKTTSLSFTSDQGSMNLLSFLQLHEIPIASSCKGRAVCQKCKINGDKLACEFTLNEFIEKFGSTISIDYL